jgi:hypothetical protein
VTNKKRQRAVASGACASWRPWAILVEVGSEPGALAQIATEALCSAVMGARRKRAAGRHDSEMQKPIAQLMTAGGSRPNPSAAPSLADYLNRLGDAASENGVIKLSCDACGRRSQRGWRHPTTDQGHDGR